MTKKPPKPPERFVYPDSPKEPEKGQSRTIKGLRLNIEAAREGKTWLLLPEGFRNEDSGYTYPLPTQAKDIRVIASIVAPPRKSDAGCKYIRRAIKESRNRQQRKLSAALDLSCRESKVINAHYDYNRTLKKLRADARMAVDEVRQEARRQTASLNTLFDLTKKGLEGLIQAYLDEKEWHGEKVRNSEFLAAGRMVTKTSKDFGLPAQPGDSMTETVIEELAESIRATQETVALAPGGDEPETEH